MSNEIRDDKSITEKIMNQTIDSGYGNIKEVTKNTEVRPPEIRSLRSLPAVKCCLREMSLILTISRATIAAINKILYTITTLLLAGAIRMPQNYL